MWLQNVNTELGRLHYKYLISLQFIPVVCSGGVSNMAYVKEKGEISIAAQETKMEDKDQSENKIGKEEPLSIEKLLQDMFVLQKIVSFLKYMAAFFSVWLVGRLGLDYKWALIATVAFYIWKSRRDEKKRKKETAQALAKNEEDVIRARLGDLPSWVFFPDVERAEWLNKFIAQLWPYVNEMVIKILKDTVEPQIQKSVPGMLKSIQFTEISLGTRPPRVGGVKVYTENVKRSEVIMDIDFIYSGDADFELSVKCVKVGVEDVQVRGTLRVIMSPLVPASPLVAGISVFFLDKPELDFNLTNLLDLFDIPGISGILRGAIDDVIASFCVLPNRICVPLLNDVSIFDLKYPIPKGVLRLEVVEARDLEKKDIGFLKKGSADPFVVVKVGAESFKTEVKKNSLSPVWNEIFEVFVDNPQGQKLKMHLYDYDKTSDNESMGYVEIEISSIAAQGLCDLWLPLEDTPSGEVHVKCTWFALSSDPKDLMLTEPNKGGQATKDMLATAAVFVRLDSAKKLPAVNKVKRSTSAMCKLTLGNKTVESQVVEDTLDPVWDEFFRFLVINAKYQELNIEVIDNNKERSIGLVEIPLDSLIDEDDMSCEQPFPLKDSGPESAIVCEVKLRALVNRQVKYDVGGDVPAVNKATKSEQAAAPVKPDSAQKSPVQKSPQPEIAKPIPPADKRESDEKVRQRKPLQSDSQAESKPPPGEVSGEIELSISYKDKTLFVEVISARKLQPCDSDGLADPYVRLFLLPDKSKSSRRKTDVVKNSLSPAFNEKFDWSLENDEIPKRTLECIVKNDVSFFSRSKTTMGRVEINLSSLDLVKGVTKWFILYDEPDSD